MAKFNRRTARIIFEEDSILPGGEVVMNLDVDMDVLMEFCRMDESDPEQESIALQRLAGLILEWNVEDDDGAEIPLNEDALFKTPPAFSMLLLRKWMEAVVEVPAPLDRRSGDGDYPPMPIPMVALK